MSGVGKRQVGTGQAGHGHVRQGQARQDGGGKRKRRVTSKDSLFHHHHPNFYNFFPRAIYKVGICKVMKVRKNLTKNLTKRYY